MNPIYKKIEALAEGIVKHYKEDLTIHDYNTLQENKGPFLWTCREMGTNLISTDTESIILQTDNFKMSFRTWVNEGSGIWIFSNKIETKKFAYFYKGNFKTATKSEMLKIAELMYIDAKRNFSINS